MKIPIHDYRRGHDDFRGPIQQYFAVFRKDATVLFEWANFQTAPGNPRTPGSPIFPDWTAFLSATEHSALEHIPGAQLTSTTLCITYTGDVILDNSRDSYKWSAARSLLSPETRPLLAMGVERGILSPDNRLFLGNWANLDGVHLGTVREALAPAQFLTLYHGTSTHREARIMRTGLRPATPAQRVWKKQRKVDAVYFSATPERAMYFARETARHDRRNAKDKSILPVILETRIPLDQPGLIADDDWIERNEGHQRSDWMASIREFGQVGLQGSVPRERLAIHPLTFRLANPQFKCAETFKAERLAA